MFKDDGTVLHFQTPKVQASSVSPEPCKRKTLALLSSAQPLSFWRFLYFVAI